MLIRKKEKSITSSSFLFVLPSLPMTGSVFNGSIHFTYVYVHTCNLTCIQRELPVFF